MNDQFTNNLKQTTARFLLPKSGFRVGGWKDYDEQVLKREGLPLTDKVEYLRFRLRMVIFDPLDNVFLNSAPHHSVVNGPGMSFFFIGTTIICCCIESLGGFILARGGGSRKRFKEFLEKYLPDWAVHSPAGVYVPDWLWENLRNALAHSLLIDNGGLENLGTFRFRDKGQKKLEVHAELLYTDLKNAVEVFFADILRDPNSDVARNFEKHFKEKFQTF